MLYRFTGQPDGGNPGTGGGVIFDGAGNIYGATHLGGANNLGAVYKLTPSNGVWTDSVLHSFTGGSDGSGPFSGPIFDQAGNLYGTAFYPIGKGTVYQLTPSGSGWAENTLYTFQGGADGSGPTAGLIQDQAGNLYGGTQTDGVGGGGTVFQLTPSRGSWSFSTLYGFTGPNYEGVFRSLVMDNAGNLYGATQGDGASQQGSVLKLTPSGSGWMYTPLHDFTGGADGGAPRCQLVFDANGNLYGTASKGGAYGYGVVFEITQ